MSRLVMSPIELSWLSSSDSTEKRALRKPSSSKTLLRPHMKSRSLVVEQCDFRCALGRLRRLSVRDLARWLIQPTTVHTTRYEVAL